jgi:malate permease and related proteins
MSVELFEAVGSVLAIVAIGIAVRKVGMLTEEADASLLRLIINLLMPCLIFSSIVGNAKVKDPVNTVWAPIAGFVGVALPMLICFVLARYVFKTKVFRDKSARRTFAVSTGLQNYGYVAIPVIDRVFGSELLGIVMLHNMGVELALWSVGIMLLNGHISRESWKKLINGPSIAVVVSLGFNALGIDQYVPQSMCTTRCTINWCYSL